MLLIFASNTLITPKPILIISDWVEINPQKPLKALTVGVHIEIDISSIYNGPSTFDGLEAKFPKGTVYGILINEKGDEIHLYDGTFALRSDGDRLRPGGIGYSARSRKECRQRGDRIEVPQYGGCRDRQNSGEIIADA